MAVYLIIMGAVATVVSLMFLIGSLFEFSHGAAYRKAQHAKTVKISSVALILSPIAGAVVPIGLVMWIIYGLFKMAALVWKAWHYEAPPARR